MRRPTCRATTCHSVSGVRDAISSSGPASPHDRRLHAAVPGRSSSRSCSPETADCRPCSGEAPAPAPTETRDRRTAGRDTAPRPTGSGIPDATPGSACAPGALASPPNGCAAPATSAGRTSPGPASAPSPDAGPPCPADRSWPSRSSAGPRYQHQRRVTRHRLERLHQLPQHSLSGRALRAPLYRLHVVIRQQTWQLRQPRRRMLPEDLNQLFASHPSPQTPEGLEHRQVGLARAVLLHALAAADAQRAALADLRQQRLHQRRLADSWLPRHEHQLPLPLERLLQPSRSHPSSASRPTNAVVPCAATGPAGAAPSGPGPRPRAPTADTPVVARAIGPMNRKPRRCTVSMYRGASDTSPSALRRSRMQLVKAASLTIVSRHSVVSSSSFVTRRPACSARCPAPRTLAAPVLEPPMPAPRPLVLHLEAYGGKLSAAHALSPLDTVLTPPRALPGGIA